MTPTLGTMPRPRGERTNHREPRRLTVSTGAREPRPASRTPIAITVPALLAAIAVAVVVALVGATSSQAASPQAAARVVATELRDSAAGRQLRWSLEASARRR